MLVSFDTVIQDDAGELVDASVEARVSTWTDRGDYGSQRMASVEALKVYGRDGQDITATLAKTDLEWIEERAMEAA